MLVKGVEDFIIASANYRSFAICVTSITKLPSFVIGKYMICFDLMTSFVLHVPKGDGLLDEVVYITRIMLLSIMVDRHFLNDH